MKVHLGSPDFNPFQVPEGNYIGTLLRTIPANTRVCQRHPVDEQIALQFSLLTPDGVDEGYIAWKPLCKTCRHGRQSISAFLSAWLGDALYDLMDEHGNVELDDCNGKKADIGIECVQSDRHLHPFSKLAFARPRGEVIS